MARIRTIKPEFWTSESVVECSCSARLLFIGMLNFADDYGNLVDSPKRLKMQIFPADNIDVAPLLDELIKNNLVIKYNVNGEKYLNIKGFKKHQVINKPSKSKIPLPSFDDNKQENSVVVEEECLNSTVVVEEECLNSTVVVEEECLTEGNGKEGNGINNNNAREEKTESNLYVSPSRRLFQITQDWKPEPNTWAETLKVSQHLVKPEQFTDYTLAEFIRTNIGKDEKTEHDWQRFYVNALARGYIKSIAENTGTRKPNPHIYQPERTGQEASQSSYEPVYKPFEPLTEAEKTKTPKDAVERMRQKMRGAA